MSSSSSLERNPFADQAHLGIDAFQQLSEEEDDVRSNEGIRSPDHNNKNKKKRKSASLIEVADTDEYSLDSLRLQKTEALGAAYAAKDIFQSLKYVEKVSPNMSVDAKLACEQENEYFDKIMKNHLYKTGPLRGDIRLVDQALKLFRPNWLAALKCVLKFL